MDNCTWFAQHFNSLSTLTFDQKNTSNFCDICEVPVSHAITNVDLNMKF